MFFLVRDDLASWWCCVTPARLCSKTTIQIDLSLLAVVLEAFNQIKSNILKESECFP